LEELKMKKIIAMLLVLAMTLCLFACNNDKKNPDNTENGGETVDEKVLYTVRVMDDKGNPVDDVVVNITPKGSSPTPFPSKDGKVEYKTAKEITATVTTLPAGYEYDKLNQAQSFDENGMLTVVLKAKSKDENAFVITVVDQNGDAVVGASVAMCDVTDSCRMPVVTGNDGSASYPLEDGEFKAKIISLPEGYSVDSLETYYYFVDGKVTITVTKN
jgi:hypothetical protein